MAPNRFSREELQARLERINERLRDQGFDVRDLVFEPPASPEQIAIAEEQLGRPIPKSLRDTFANLSAHVEFRWFTQDFTFPKPFHENFSGDLHWSLELLVQFEADRKSWINKVFPNPEDPYDVIWHDKLPFHAVGNGDFLSVATDDSIVYLSHDDGEGHGHVLARDFDDLLRVWLPLACPGGEDWQWLPFTSDAATPIDPNSTTAVAWQKLIGI